MLPKDPKLTRIQSLYLGLAAAVVFTVMASIHLDGQGVYYDELHQAPAAFDYLGKHAPVFNYSFHGIPILNMSYSGAIKSNVYGLYLKYVDPHFTVYSWRFVGIVFVAIGVFGFYQIAGVSLPRATAVLFAALLLTDASVLLTTRHDWGPTALALCFRLAFLAVWLSIQLSEPSGFKHFAAGFLVGAAIFEKLSAVVLLTPFCILLFMSRRRAPRAWIAGVLGLLAGSLPLLLVNIGSYARAHSLISLSGLSMERARAGAPDLLAYAYQYLALAQGGMARQLILGDSPVPFWAQTEAALTLLVLVTIAVAAFRSRSTNRLMALAGVMAVAYVVVGISVFLLPRDTFVHHWILGTPFQYAAIALALPAFANPAEHGTRGRAVYRVAFVAAVAALLAIRLPDIVAVEKSLVSGRASTLFDPAFTRLAEIAAERSTDAAFISADWGTATQVYCAGNGRDDLVYEPFWNNDPAKAVLEIAQTTKKDNLYLLVTGIAPQFEQASASAVRSMVNSPNWHEVPVENEFAGLAPIQIRKFTRRTTLKF
jgi:hypothetical protein